MEFTEQLQKLINLTVLAHSILADKPGKSVRKFDNTTPYAIHPIWCAMTILAEENLSLEIRELGAEVLLLHDFDEDTKAGIPDYTSEKTKHLLLQMIFQDSAHEMEEIWNRDKLVVLFKLYDKVSNMMDSGWMPEERGIAYYRERIDYLCKLTDFIERTFGRLNITVMARAITKERSERTMETLPEIDETQAAKVILTANPNPVEIRDILQRVTNDEIPGLPTEKQPFLYASGNWGPGYITIKSLVSQEEVMDFLAKQAASKIAAQVPSIDFIAGNVTGGVIPAWKIHLHLEAILGKQLHYVYVGGSRKEPGSIISVNKEALEAVVLELRRTIDVLDINCDFVAGVTPGGMILAYQLSRLLFTPFVYIRDKQKKGGQKEVITGIKDHPLIPLGSHGIVIGQVNNFRDTSDYGCEVLRQHGFNPLNGKDLLSPAITSKLSLIETGLEENESGIDLGMTGVDIEELVNFAQTTCNSTLALRNAGLNTETAATILFYNNPNAIQSLQDNGIEMIYLLTLPDLLNVAEETKAHPIKHINGYREFLKNPPNWQNQRGLTPIKRGGTI